MQLKLLPLICVLICLLSGCTKEGGYKLPGVYRIDIQQGNVLDQAMVIKLKPGMDKNQVRFILGTPVLVDPFHSDRWEYVYTLSEHGNTRQQRHITLYFEDEKLAYVEGDIVPGDISSEQQILPVKQTKTVDVPLRQKKESGFFRNIFSILPFVDAADATRIVTPPKQVSADAEETAAEVEAVTGQDTTDTN